MEDREGGLNEDDAGCYRNRRRRLPSQFCKCLHVFQRADLMLFSPSLPYNASSSSMTLITIKGDRFIEQECHRLSFAYPITHSCSGEWRWPASDVLSVIKSFHRPSALCSICSRVQAPQLCLFRFSLALSLAARLAVGHDH